DIGGAILPTILGLPITRFGVGMWPNESYYSSESSEMCFDPRCYNTIWIGNSNKILRSDDGGGSYNLIYTFGTDANANVSYIEIAQSNPMVMYVVQRPSSGNTGKLWKTTDGGTSWTQLTIPAGTSSRIDISVSATNEDSLWIAYPGGSNGNKVFVTANGGASWNNLTTAVLDNEEGRWIMNIAATNGGVYYVTENTVYYRNNSMGNWIVDNTGLPVYLNSLNSKPFYRDGKIRVSSYGRGIWENSLNDQPSHPVAQPQVDKLNYSINCALDSFYFEDHSELNHAGATWHWFFPGGSPSSSTLRNPAVLYTTTGTYIATLVVTDASMQTDTASLTINVSTYIPGNIPTEDFQGVFPPTGWWITSTSTSGQWTLSTQAGGYGLSTQSMFFDNFTFDAQGGISGLNIRANMTQLSSNKLFFDDAYSFYGSPYTDTLEVAVSTDCGATYTRIFAKGGASLATAPSNQSNTFVPTATQWRTDSVDLSAWMTQTDLILSIRNHGFYGQGLYVDNINIGNQTAIREHTLPGGYATLFPNPVASGQTLTLQSDKDEKFLVEIFNDEGELVLREPHRRGDQVFTGNLARGTYVYRVTGETMIRNNYLIVQ
ncbi:MAG TPA: T9SS type A sorting domain-containing protein, partial [Bacteroidia bacterium]|nr:T9SS type A sorting domain-containing protein [Bacteroidia bacterium]